MHMYLKHECAKNVKWFPPLTFYSFISPSTPPGIPHQQLHTAFSADGMYTYQGSDAPEASSDGRPSDNSFYGNTISNTETGVKVKEGGNIIITGEIKYPTIEVQQCKSFEALNQFTGECYWWSIEVNLVPRGVVLVRDP